MNRISIYYSSKNEKKHTTSKLYINNDIKGLTSYKVGTNFFGNDADIMLEVFKNTKIKKDNKIIAYIEIYIDNEIWCK